MNSDLMAVALALRPEITLVVGALVALAVDLTALRTGTAARRQTVAVAIGAFALVLATAFTALDGSSHTLVDGVLRIDTLAEATRIGVLSLTLLCLGVAGGAKVLRHPAEYVAVVLMSATGLCLMASSQHLLVSYLTLELASLGLYVLAGFDKRRAASSEAGLKYFLSGGLAAAFFLFGLSLIYGLTGSLELGAIAQVVASTGVSPLMIVALVMVVLALGFKVASAPFHYWAPDTYQGAPLASVTLIGSAAKLAGLVFFARLLWPGLGAAAGNLSLLEWRTGWLPAVAAISAASLLLGNVGALAQTDLRRLLAYSAISHGGSLLIGVIVAGPAGPVPLFFYAVTYGVATVGSFGVLAVLERAGVGMRLRDMAGLWKRSPLLAGCLFIFLLSLAGVPPLAGFLGKFMVFGEALRLGGLNTLAGWLAFLAIAMSVVGLFYYLKVLKQALVNPPAPGAGPVAVPEIAGVALVLAALILVVLGVAPGVVLGRF